MKAIVGIVVVGTIFYAAMFMVGMILILPGRNEQPKEERANLEIVGSEHSIGNLRSAFIELNAEFVNASNVLRGRGIQVELTLVNVGTAPNSGDGDLIPVAARKAATNVSVLIKAAYQ